MPPVLAHFEGRPGAAPGYRRKIPHPSGIFRGQQAPSDEGELRRQLPHENLRFHVHTILAQSGVIVDSLRPLCGKIVEKAQLPWIPPEISKAVEAALQDVAVSAVWSSASSMEITHPDANKGAALASLCRLLNISPENTMALGDSGNDEGMLRAAGLGVAMGNAPEFIKIASDAVTETNANDGAAIAIERFCL